MKTKLLGVIGSLNRNSLTRHAVGYVLEQAKACGAEVQTLDLNETPLPLFNPERPQHAEYLQARDQVNWANAYLLGTPDYHGGMSGAMKNFLDYFWKEFSGKLFGYVCASHEKGLTAMDQMRTSIRQCYGWSVPYGACITDDDFDKNSKKIINPKIAGRLELLAYDLTTYAPLLRKQFEADVASLNAKAGFASHHQPKKK